MKNKIKNLITTIEKSESHHCEVFSLKDKQKVRVSVDEYYSPDGRGWLYQLSIKTLSPRLFGRPYSYCGGKSHIKRLLIEWLNGEKELNHCPWANYALPTYMLTNTNS